LNKFSLTGKKALITGGNRGIGLGIAQEFAQAGADLVLLARDQVALEEARGQLESTGRRVAVYSFDLNNVEEIPEMYAHIIRDSGAIDILVNNAGTICRGPAEEISLEDWSLVMTVNLTAVFVLSQAFAREHISSRLCPLSSLCPGTHQQQTTREDYQYRLANERSGPSGCQSLCGIQGRH